tara:strand:- start:655 stop:1239 length:585 start_codon:yes stop_codon:yes gene_type:complete
MKFEIFKFKDVTSTNDIAINLIRKKNKKNGCILAKKQTKGRGTYGKKWISRNGNFFATIFFKLKKNYPPSKEFDIINQILISNVIKKICKKNKIQIKFPNDIFLNKKKICGILQEVIMFNEEKFLIIGIGINIVSNPNVNINYKTTNIYTETKIKPNINKLINSIISSYKKFFLNLKNYNYLNFKFKVNKMTIN